VFNVWCRGCLDHGGPDHALWEFSSYADATKRMSWHTLNTHHGTWLVFSPEGRLLLWQGVR